MKGIINVAQGNSDEDLFRTTPENLSSYEAERGRPAPRPWASPLVPLLAAPRVGRAAVWASVPFRTYQVAGASQMG